MRQFSHASVLVTAAHALRFSEQDWKNYCLVQLCDDGRNMESTSAIRKEIASVRRKIVLKRPAGSVQKKPAKRIKRTPFNLKR